MMNFFKTTSWRSAGRRFHIVAFSLLAGALLVAPGRADAQTQTVNGTVRDSDGAPMIGVSVTVKGGLNGTSTGIDGTFMIRNVDPTDGVLVFSFLGFKPQEIAVSGRTSIDVTMEEDFTRLSNVVVVGYGSLSKREISSSVVQVDRENFHQGAINSPMELLAGKVAGVSIINPTLGDPNSSANVQIRGVGSFSAGIEPLYVIDGMAGGDLKALAPQDIESITVLKDAASAAIYGSRGANGVILITTKGAAEGGRGAHRMTYDSWFAFNTPTGIPDILSADEFRRSLRSNDYGYSTDWYSQLLRDFGYINNQYLSMDGNTDKGGYSASLSYRKGAGLDIASAREEFGGRFAARHRALNDYLELSGDVNARKVKETWGDNGMFNTASTLNPTMPIYNEDGTFYHPTSPTGVRNPVESLTDEKRGGERIYLLSNIEAKVKIINTTHHSLSTTMTYGLNYNDLYQHYFTPTTSAASAWGEYDGRASLTYEKWWSNQFEWFANYTFEMGDHLLRATAGYSWLQNDYERHWLENAGFDYDQFLWHRIDAGSALADGMAGMSSDKNRKRFIAGFGRVNYSWREIVTVTASLRREGGTLFGENYKWGYFPGVSGAVEFANTPWLDGTEEVINSLRLRASYGSVGRANFSPYLSLANYGVVNNDSNRGWRYPFGTEWVQAYGPIKNANPDLRWERAVTTNIGIDFVLLDRIRGSVEWFNRQSKDLLLEVYVPQPPFIKDRMMVNVGNISNKGVEINLEGDIFRGHDFSWTSGVIFTYGKTRLESLSQDGFAGNYIDLYSLPGIGTTESLFRYGEGNYIGDFWGYEHAGIDEDGNLLIYNKAGEVIPKTAADANNDKRTIGNGTPDFLYSWNNTFRYKDFDLGFTFRGAGGFDVFNLRKYSMGMRGSGTTNVLREAYLANRAVTQDPAVISSYYLERGDFLNMESLTLGYTVPFQANKFVSSARVYFSAKNLFTITGYSGSDPVSLQTNGLTPSVNDATNYPLARQWTFGVTLSFK